MGEEFAENVGHCNGNAGGVDAGVAAKLVRREQITVDEQAHGALCDFVPTVTQSHEAKIQSGYRRALLAKTVGTIFSISNFLKNRKETLWKLLTLLTLSFPSL